MSFAIGHNVLVNVPQADIQCGIGKGFCQHILEGFVPISDKNLWSFVSLPEGSKWGDQSYQFFCHIFEAAMTPKWLFTLFAQWPKGRLSRIQTSSSKKQWRTIGWLQFGRPHGHCQKIWLGWLHLSLYWMQPSDSNLGARHQVNL
jgi:hypothetical protein